MGRMTIEKCEGRSPTDPFFPSFSKVGSTYGVRGGRTTGSPTFHAGVDFVGVPGDPVRAFRAGQVKYIARDFERKMKGFDGYGNAVVLYHPQVGLYSFHAHLSDVGVTEGQIVRPGQVIGRIGNTTNGKFRGMGAHLHFEIRRPKENGAMPFPAAYGIYNLDPLPVLASAGVQISPTGAIAERCIVAPLVG
jgi:murein DD-endopeptidase MepM/ murein hydrolase activator NlpD